MLNILFLLKQEAELLVNVTEHYLVPKHEVLSTEQRQELFQKYNVKSIQVSVQQFHSISFRLQHGFKYLDDFPQMRSHLHCVGICSGYVN